MAIPAVAGRLGAQVQQLSVSLNLQCPAALNGCERWCRSRLSLRCMVTDAALRRCAGRATAIMLNPSIWTALSQPAQARGGIGSCDGPATEVVARIGWAGADRRDVGAAASLS